MIQARGDVPPLGCISQNHVPQNNMVCLTAAGTQVGSHCTFQAKIWACKCYPRVAALHANCVPVILKHSAFRLVSTLPQCIVHFYHGSCLMVSTTLGSSSPGTKSNSLHAPSDHAPAGTLGATTTPCTAQGSNPISTSTTAAPRIPVLRLLEPMSLALQPSSTAPLSAPAQRQQLTTNTNIIC